MSLRSEQSAFLKDFAKLVLWAFENGYELTEGEGYRTPEQAKLNASNGKGIANSLHCDRLAHDVNLFKDGKYLSDSESYQPLGEYWKSLDPVNKWGGDFKKLKDGNHFSRSTGDGRE
jgi:hypothetical protein